MTTNRQKKITLEDVRPKAQDGLGAFQALSDNMVPRQEVEYMLATGKTQEEARRDLAYIQSLSGRYAVGTNPFTIMVNDADMVSEVVDEGTAYVGAFTGPWAATGNPIGVGLNTGVNFIGGVADVYQLGRSLYKGDYIGAGINGAELGMSIIGGRGVKSAIKGVQSAERAVQTASTPAQKQAAQQALRKAKRALTIEKAEAVGYDEAIAGSKLFDAEGAIRRGLNTRTKRLGIPNGIPRTIGNPSIYIAPQDNTRVVRPNLDIVAPRNKKK